MGIFYYKAQAIFPKGDGSGIASSPNVHVGKNFVFVSNSRENSNWEKNGRSESVGEFIITAGNAVKALGEPQDFMAQLVHYPGDRGDVACVIPVSYSKDDGAFQVIPTMNKVTNGNQPRIYKIFESVYVIVVYKDGRTMISLVTPRLDDKEVQKGAQSFVVKVHRETVFYSRNAPPVYDDTMLKSAMGTASMFAPFVKLAHEGLQKDQS